MPDVRLISSPYAAEEARRNLKGADQRDRLEELLQSVKIISALLSDPLPEGVKLPVKDAPILQAAIAAKATHLLTSDLKHFGAYYWQIIEGVTILPPAAYLKKRGQ
ncbi:MAG: PIN domain-containing protein [Bryobacteraceae bacterium]